MRNDGVSVVPVEPVRWEAFVALVPGFLFSNVESALTNIALPAIQEDLALPVAWVGWIPLACLLPTAALSPLAGMVADRVGRRRVYLFGLAAVTLGSCAGALASHGLALLAARAIQGIGAAAVVANGLAIIADEFLEQERGKAIGRMTALMAAGGILAPLVGGAVIQYWGWRGVFWVQAGVTAVGYRLVTSRLPRGPRVPSRWWRDVSWATGGTLVLAAATGLTGLWAAGSRALPEDLAIALIAVGLAALGVTWNFNRSSRVPLIRYEQVSASTAWVLASLALGSAVLAAFGFILPLYLAHVQGLAGMQLGLEVVPFPVGLVVGSLVGGRHGDRRGTRGPIVVGLLLAGGGLLAHGGLGTPALAIIGAGLGAFSVGANAAIVRTAGPGIGTVTGLAGLLRRIGYSTGIVSATVVLGTSGFGAGLGWIAGGVAAALLVVLPALPSLGAKGADLDGTGCA